MGINPIRPNDYWVLTKNPFNPKIIYPNSTQLHSYIKKKETSPQTKLDSNFLIYVSLTFSATKHIPILLIS